MSETTREPTSSTTGPDNLKWLSGFASLVGAWIAISPFVYTMPATGYWNNVIIGVAIFLVAGYNYYRVTQGLTISVGSSAFVALLGLWMILVPFVLDAGGTAPFWSDIVSGAVVALVAGYNAYAGRQAEAAAPAAGT